MGACVFCSILNKEIPAKIIAENEHAMAFLDVNPVSDGHTLVISKKHYPNFSSCDPIVLQSIVALAQKVACAINESKLRPWGFNYLCNEGSIAGQEIMHIHLHVIPKYAKNEGFQVKTGLKYLHDIEENYKEIVKTYEKLNDPNKPKLVQVLKPVIGTFDEKTKKFNCNFPNKKKK